LKARGVHVVAESMVSNTDWASLACASGTAFDVDIESRLLGILSSENKEEIWANYMHVESEVVSQRNLTGSAPRVLEIAFASFLSRRGSGCRAMMYNLIYEIARASEGAETLIGEGAEIYLQCWRRVNEGLWIMVREMVAGDDGAADIVEVVNPRLYEEVRESLTKA
jgi:hypothetical protein